MDERLAKYGDTYCQVQLAVAVEISHRYAGQTFVIWRARGGGNCQRRLECAVTISQEDFDDCTALAYERKVELAIVVKVAGGSRSTTRPYR
jgi:hypothetical protein